MTLNAQPKASHFIDGAFVEDSAGQSFDVVYPATGERIATLHCATPALIERALAAAERAQRDWAARPGVERGRILRRAADLIRDRNADLSRLETLHTGKPLQETLVADPTSAADALEYFGGMAASFAGEHIAFGGDFAYTIREPLGVCVGIGAWNYPMQIAAWKSAPALACGNAMVFKPSEVTPLTALALAEIYQEAGLPNGLFSVLQGMGEVGGALVTDPRVAKVSLTGSVPTGQKVYSAAAAGLRHVTMELGGKSPILIFEDADLDSAVSGVINGNFYATGQVCSNGTRVFVQKQMVEPLLARLIERLKGVCMGDPLDMATNFGPMASARQRDIVLGHIAKGVAEGARLVTGGKSVAGPGFFIDPTVFADVTDDMHIARTEIFGPVMSVLTFEHEDEAITRSNNTEFGLSGAVFTRNITRAHRVAAALQAGSVWINQYNLTPVEVPFGGSKMSGVGRENGRIAIEHYSQLKTVYVGMSPVQAAY